VCWLRRTLRNLKNKFVHAMSLAGDLAGMILIVPVRGDTNQGGNV